MDLYHVVGDGWDGKELLSLHDQYGDDAYDIFAERWPEADGLGIYHAHRIFFYDTLADAQDHAAELGGKVLKIDADKISDQIKIDDLECPFYVSTEPVPASVITVI